jgi:hypothetical protein
MNVFGYLEEVLLLFKELLCNLYLLSILEVFYTLTLLYMECTSGLFIYLKHLVHNIWHHYIDPRVFLLQASHLIIFALTLSGMIQTTQLGGYLEDI